MKRISRGFILIVVLCFSAGSWADTTYSDVIVFGDSLSDNGNLIAFINNQLPGYIYPYPYDATRLTNYSLDESGQVVHSSVAVEVMATELGFVGLTPAIFGGTNYAIAGASAATNAPGDLFSQVKTFVDGHESAGIPIPNDALYVVFIGANDVRAARDTSDRMEAQKIILKAASNINLAVQKLISLGAKHIAVVNSPDIGAIPETRLIALDTQNPFLPLMASWRSKQFNALLFFKILGTQWLTRTKITQINLFGTLNNIIANAAQLGYVNAQEPCVIPESDASGLIIGIAAAHPACGYGEQATNFVFFDPIHPSTKTHRMAGEAFAARIQ